MAASAGVATAVTYVMSAMQLVPAIISAGLSLKDLAEDVITVIKRDNGPTDEDLARLADRRTAIRLKLEEQGKDMAGL